MATANVGILQSQYLKVQNNIKFSKNKGSNIMKISVRVLID